MEDARAYSVQLQQHWETSHQHVFTHENFIKYYVSLTPV